MKSKIICIILAVALLLTLAGCSASNGKSENAESSASTESAQISENVSEEPAEESSPSQSTEEPEETTDAELAADSGQQISGQNVAVVYYSATGNTKNVAEMIGNLTGAEVFELTPEEPYTDEDLNFNEESSRVVQEYENEDQRNVKLSSTEIPNWDEYDTIFLGYPIWWGIAAWPINDFVLNNNFDAKTVYPFCTSLSSGLGQSAQLLADEANTGEWEEGHRFSENADEADVLEWLTSLGIE